MICVTALGCDLELGSAKWGSEGSAVFISPPIEKYWGSRRQFNQQMLCFCCLCVRAEAVLDNFFLVRCLLSDRHLK